MRRNEMLKFCATVAHDRNRITARLAAAAFAVLCAQAPAATFQVDRTDDPFPGSACSDAVPMDCSLRDAVNLANLTPGPDTVSIPAGVYTLTRTGSGDDTNNLGDLDITETVLLRGAGAEETIIDAGGTGGLGDRVVDVLGAAGTEFEDLTIQGGRITPVGEDGGGIRSNSQVLLRRVTLCDNQADDRGGGIYAEANLTVIDSFFCDNVAGQLGGGIGQQADTLTVSGSQFDGNTALQGGGLNTFGLHTSIANSQFTGNSAPAAGGGVSIVSETSQMSHTVVENNTTSTRGGGAFIQTIMEMDHVLIRGNEADVEAGGLYSTGGANRSFLMRNSTITNNSAPAHAAILMNVDQDTMLENITISGHPSSAYPIALRDGPVSVFHGTFVNNAASVGTSALLVENGMLVLANTILGGTCELTSGSTTVSVGGNIESPANTCMLNQASDQPNTGNPMLEPLADYGGFTPTHRPTEASPALDAGRDDNCEDIATDQRDLPREVAINGASPRCDVGAVELQQSESGLIYRDSFES